MFSWWKFKCMIFCINWKRWQEINAGSFHRFQGFAINSSQFWYYKMFFQAIHSNMTPFTRLLWSLYQNIWAASWENGIIAYAKTKAQISFAVTAKLISAFVFATRIVQFLFYLNPKFQASSSFLSLYRPVCVGPGRKPRRPVFSHRGSFMKHNLHEKPVTSEWHWAPSLKSPFTGYSTILYSNRPDLISRYMKFKR